MRIPFLDLKAQYQSIKPEIDEAIKRVIDSQSFILGNELVEFEKEFANYLGVKYAVGVNSGTDALILSLMSLGIGKGDEVIVPVNSFIATALAITLVGATPVLTDCDSKTYEIDVEQVRKKINKKTKAVMPVHLYGASAKVDELRKVADQNGLFLIEDAAQAHGATFKNQKLGTFGDLGAFSFYPGKNLGAYGDAGAVVTNNGELYEKLCKLRNYGQTKKYYHDSLGFNSRLDEIQAAVLRVKLKYLDGWNKKRNSIAERYDRELKGFKTQTILEGSTSNYYLFVIETDKRDQLQDYLSKQGIETLIHYPVPIHLQKVYQDLGYKKDDFPVAEKLAGKILSIPIFPELEASGADFVIKTLNDFIKI
jgi:dTDP-4-amino-4,6-dideoxygalactose transaminase